MTNIQSMGKNNSLNSFLIFNFHNIFYLFFSLGLNVTLRVLKQRINDIEEEYERKYNDAKEQLKNDPRLTVDAIVTRLDEKTQ